MIHEKRKKQHVCYYCGQSNIESITAYGRTLPKDEQPVITEPIYVFLEQIICSKCREGLRIHFKEILHET